MFSQVFWEMLNHSGQATSLGILGFPSKEIGLIILEVADLFLKILNLPEICRFRGLKLLTSLGRIQLSLSQKIFYIIKNNPIYYKKIKQHISGIYCNLNKEGIVFLHLQWNCRFQFDRKFNWLCFVLLFGVTHLLFP